MKSFQLLLAFAFLASSTYVCEASLKAKLTLTTSTRSPSFEHPKNSWSLLKSFGGFLGSPTTTSAPDEYDWEPSGDHGDDGFKEVCDAKGCIRVPAFAPYKTRKPKVSSTTARPSLAMRPATIYGSTKEPLKALCTDAAGVIHVATFPCPKFNKYAKNIRPKTSREHHKMRSESEEEEEEEEEDDKPAEETSEEPAAEESEEFDPNNNLVDLNSATEIDESSLPDVPEEDMDQLKGVYAMFLARKRGRHNRGVKFPLWLNFGRAWNTGGKDWSVNWWGKTGQPPWQRWWG